MAKIKDELAKAKEQLEDARKAVTKADVQVGITSRERATSPLFLSPPPLPSPPLPYYHVFNQRCITTGPS